MTLREVRNARPVHHEDDPQPPIAALRVAIYTRVSDADQGKHGTHKQQLAQLEKYAKQTGYVIAGAWNDGDEKGGRSATSGPGKMEARDGLHAMFAAMKRGEFDAILVVHQDRLCRADSIFDQAFVFGTIQDAKCVVMEHGRGVVDLSTVMGRIMAFINANMSADEAKKIAERTMRGKDALLAQGGKPHGMPPYGLRYDRKAGWSVDEHEANIIREIVRRVREGESCDRIAVELTARGEKPPGKRWGGSVVRSLVVFASFRYLGRWRANKERDLWVEIPHCRILTDAEASIADASLLRHKRRGREARTRHVYMLDARGVKCGKCGGWAGVLGPGIQGKTYYRCRSYRLPKGAPGRCNLRGAHQPTLDAKLWTDAVAFLNTPDLVKRALRGVSDTGTADQRASRVAVDKASEALAKVEKKLRAHALLSDSMDGDLALEKAEKLVAEKVRAVHDLREAEAKARETSTTPVTKVDLESVVTRMRKRCARATEAERRVIVRTLLVDAVITDEELTARWGVPVVDPVHMTSSTRANRIYLGTLRIPLSRRTAPPPIKGEGGRFAGKRAA